MDLLELSTSLGSTNQQPSWGKEAGQHTVICSLLNVQRLDFFLRVLLKTSVSRTQAGVRVAEKTRQCLPVSSQLSLTSSGCQDDLEVIKVEFNEPTPDGVIKITSH